MSDNPDSRQGLYSKPVAGIHSSADVEPHLRMWGAALALLIQDALDYQLRGPGGVHTASARREAHEALTQGDAMLHRLCGLACVDVDYVRALWRRRLREVLPQAA